MSQSKTLRTRFFITALLALSFDAAWAYQFFQVNNGGVFTPVKWQSPPVNFAVDNGPTNILAEIQGAVDEWNNVSTAKNVLGALTLAVDGSGNPVDFTGANFGTAWGSLTADGRQEVILDEDGTAFAAVGLDPASVNGFGPSRREVVDGKGSITDAYLLLNGTRDDFDRRSTDVHELGHIQGLAHSSVGMFNSNSPPGEALEPININSVPTMHPFSSGTGTARQTVEADDIAGISELYPEDSFFSSLGSLSGKVTRCEDGKAVKGVNVRAVSASDSNLQVSRYTSYDNNPDGRYTISGLPPGDYHLIIEPMGTNGFTKGRMAIISDMDTDVPTEYRNPPDEDDCTEDLPDTPVNSSVAAGTTTIDQDLKVGGVKIAFVVDDTGSMGEEIDAVRQILTNAVSFLSSAAASFPTTAVVTFKDDVTHRISSSDPAKVQAVIDSLTASGGGDCPESSNAALLASGRLMTKNGKALLFTDADSRPDGPSRAAVESLYLSKSMTISTLLSGSCTESLSAAASPMKAVFPATFGGDSSNFDEYPPEPTLGFEGAVRTFSEFTDVTNGIFAPLQGINSGDPVERQRYINTGTNLAISGVLPSVTLVTSPVDGPQGTTLNIEIFGANTNWLDTSTVTFSGTDIQVNSVHAASATRLNANITIAPGAPPGFRDVTVKTNLSGAVETATGIGAFNVVAAPTSPTIVDVSPSTGFPGQTLDVAITGGATNFVNGTSTADFGSEITVNSVSVSSPTQAVANITIANDAVIGLRDVSVTTDAEFAGESVEGPFRVASAEAAIPIVAGIRPTQVFTGDTASLTITGENTHFGAGSVVSFEGSGITVNSVAANSPTELVANIAVAPDAALGFRDVTVDTESESAVGLDRLLISSRVPLTLVDPPALRAGASGAVVKLVAEGAHFATDSAVDFGDPAITVNSVTLVSPTELQVSVSLPNAVALGARDILVNTASVNEQAALADGLLIDEGCFGLAPTIKGTDGNDKRLKGTKGDDVILGLGGNDRIFGRGGNDRICAGDGDDRIMAEAGDDQVDAGAGADFVDGGGGSDLLLGGEGDDLIKGKGKNDILDGGPGTDKLVGGPGKSDQCLNGEKVRSCEK
jgi:hypothetical protein